MFSAEIVMSFDRSGRVERIARLWPEFPRQVVERFGQLWGHSEPHASRLRERYKDFIDPKHPAILHADFLTWEEEVFEIAFQESLIELVPHLWSGGLRGEVELD